jgi:hypothetical protein
MRYVSFHIRGESACGSLQCGMTACVCVNRHGEATAGRCEAELH